MLKARLTENLKSKQIKTTINVCNDITKFLKEEWTLGEGQLHSEELQTKW
jgi:hypothetical protein